jgi:UDP-N-acetylmuramoyl-L-alanyl-D-glutamate--2,6-diaminopimelate ligase
VKPADDPIHVRTLDYRDVVDCLQRAELLLSHSSDIKGTGSLTVDSRCVQVGDIFLAYPGVNVDGRKFIDSAIANGAGLIISEYPDPTHSHNGGTPRVLVKSARAAWAWLESLRYHHPQDKIVCFGVTGTNGKTSTAWLLAGLLEGAGRKPVYIGTVGIKFNGVLTPTSHTSPDPNFLYKAIANAVENGADTLVMEVSSHALAMEKLTPIRFDGAAWTSFSRDHLDYHHTMDEYWATKEKLFTTLLKPGARVVIHDSITPRPFLNPEAHLDSWCYGSDDKWDHNQFNHRCQYRWLTESPRLSKIRICIDKATIEGQSNLFGQHSAANLSCAVTLALKVLPFEMLSPDSLLLAQIPGRLENVSENLCPSVIVDYAHTPDALEKALMTARSVLHQGKLWVVFGCGGNRDKGKRPEMGRIASILADFSVITSDNPRDEDPNTIISEVVAGIVQNGARFRVEPDRQLAIEYAVFNADSSDLIVVAGKGHENYQIIGKNSFEFNDGNVARASLIRRQRIKENSL